MPVQNALRDAAVRAAITEAGSAVFMLRLALGFLRVVAAIIMTYCSLRVYMAYEKRK